MKKSVFFVIIFSIIYSACGNDRHASSPDYSSCFTIKSNRITWYLEKEPEAWGYFIDNDDNTRDPWVKGPVKVMGVDPAPVTRHGVYMNGSMVNPPNGAHAYDSRANRFDGQYKVNFPLEIQSDASFVSTMSVSLNDNLSTSQSYVQAASVLTVLSETPPEGSFRPGLIGNKQNLKLYNINDIKWDALPNPKLPRTASMADVAGIKNRYVDGLKRPWLLHNRTWTCRYIMPRENSPDYLQYFALLISEASVYCLSDWSDSEDDERELVINYLQVALDYYTMQQQDEMGAFNFRWPVVFAGIMLGDDDMKNMWVNGTFSTPSYADAKVYRYADGRRTLKSKVLADGQSWTGATVLWRNEIGNYGEHEVLAPSEWPEGAGYFNKPSGIIQEGYRRMHTPYMVGFALCAIVLNAESSLNFPDYVPYVTRWMSETGEFLEAKGHGPDGTHPVATSRNAYVDEMWGEHGSGK